MFPDGPPVPLRPFNEDDDEPPNCDSNSQVQVSMGDVAMNSDASYGITPVEKNISAIDSKVLR